MAAFLDIIQIFQFGQDWRFFIIVLQAWCMNKLQNELAKNLTGFKHFLF
jgi:hypothetical protein